MVNINIAAHSLALAATEMSRTSAAVGQHLANTIIADEHIKELNAAAAALAYGINAATELLQRAQKELHPPRPLASSGDAGQDGVATIAALCVSAILAVELHTGAQTGLGATLEVADGQARTDGPTGAIGALFERLVEIGVSTKYRHTVIEAVDASVAVQIRARKLHVSVRLCGVPAEFTFSTSGAELVLAYPVAVTVTATTPQGGAGTLTVEADADDVVAGLHPFKTAWCERLSALLR
jgi:hypothetical protein